MAYEPFSIEIILVFESGNTFKTRQLTVNATGVLTMLFLHQIRDHHVCRLNLKQWFDFERRFSIHYVEISSFKLLQLSKWTSVNLLKF